MINTRALYQLALANWRKLLRDIKMIIYVFIPPLLTMLVLPVGAALMKEEGLITIVVPADASQQTHDLAAELQSSRRLTFEVIDDAEGQRRKENGEFEVLVFLPSTLDADSVVIETPPDSIVKVYAIKSALDRAARPPLLALQCWAFGCAAPSAIWWAERCPLRRHPSHWGRRSLRLAP